MTKLENYREETFKRCSSLKYLDGTDIDGNEEDDEDDGDEEDAAGEVRCTASLFLNV